MKYFFKNGSSLTIDPYKTGDETFDGYSWDSWNLGAPTGKNGFRLSQHKPSHFWTQEEQMKKKKPKKPKPY